MPPDELAPAAATPPAGTEPSASAPAATPPPAVDPAAAAPPVAAAPVAAPPPGAPGDAPPVAAIPAAAATPPAVEPVKEWKKDLIPERGWPDDWKERIVAEYPADQQAKVREFLKTRNSPVELANGGISAQAKITEATEKAKGLVKIPGKDAKPDEIAAFNKAIGVPDDPKAYSFGELPEGQTLSPLDEMFQEKARPALLAAGLTQSQVDAGLKLIELRDEIASNEKIRAANAAAERAQDDLRVHFGPREYQNQIEVINRWFEKYVAQIDPAMKDGLKTIQPNGGTLGDQAWLVKALATTANQWADDNNIPRGQIESGVDIDRRKQEILGWSQGTPEQKKQYASESVQNELKQIIARQLRHGKVGKAA